MESISSKSGANGEQVIDKKDLITVAKMLNSPEKPSKEEFLIIAKIINRLKALKRSMDQKEFEDYMEKLLIDATKEEIHLMLDCMKYINDFMDWHREG